VKNGHSIVTIRKKVLLCCMINGMILLGACNGTRAPGSTLPPNYGVEIPYSDLVLEELGQNILANPGMLECSLFDLPPFGWKEVNVGIVDIRTSEDYAIRVGPLYQEGFRAYLDNRMDFPETFQSIPEMSFEEFLTTCNVFPHVDFSQYSVLGYHATGTGCKVTFEKQVYRDDLNKTILYELTVIEEGVCKKDVNSRNLILVPRIPSDYHVGFSKTRP